MKNLMHKTFKKVMATLASFALLIGVISPMVSIAASSDASAPASLTVELSPTKGSFKLYDVSGNQYYDNGTIYTGQFNTFNLNAGDYKLEFGDVDNYSKPTNHNQVFSLTSNEVKTVQGFYGASNSSPASLTVELSPTKGSFKLYDVSGNQYYDNGTIYTGQFNTFNLNAGDYKLEFGDVDNYSKPTNHNQVFSLTSNEVKTVQGFYNAVNPEGTITVELSPTKGSFQVYDTKNGKYVGGTYTGQFNTMNLPTGEYKLEFDDVNGYSKPDIDNKAFTLGENETKAFKGFYNPANNSGNPKAGGTITVELSPTKGSFKIYDVTNGQYYDNGTTYTGQFNTLNLPAGEYRLEFGDVSGYSKPDIHNKAFTLGENETKAFKGFYNPANSGLAKGTLIVKSFDDQGNTFPDAKYIVKKNGAQSGNEKSGDINESAEEGKYSIEAKTVTVNNNTYKPTVTQVSTTDAIAQNGDIVEFKITYAKSNTTTDTGIVEVKQSSVNGTFPTVSVKGPNATGFDVTTASDSKNNMAAGDYTLEITNIPAGYEVDTVSVDENGTATNRTAPYSGNLTANGKLTYTVSYKQSTGNNGDAISVSKTATIVSTASTTNEVRVKYTVAVTRNNNGNNDAISVDLTDTITGSQQLIGTGGNGQLNYTLNTFKCEGTILCDTKGMAQGIADAKITVKFDPNTQGKSAIISYEMTSNNSAQTAAENFTNQITATYNDPQTGAKTLTANATVTVQPRGNGGGNNGGGGGSTGGGGGGMRLTRGDMELEITRKLSTDGKNYTNDYEVNVGKNTTTPVYVKLYVTNKGVISAKDITLAPFFREQSSNMTASEITDLKGAEWNNDRDAFVIKKINVNETYLVTYKRNVSDNGSGNNPSIEGVKLTEFRGNVDKTFDALNYIGIGKEAKNELYARDGNTSNQDGVLAISVKSDKSGAKIGESVEFTVQAKNISDDDLTGLILTHQLPTELGFVNPGSGNVDGSEIQWTRPQLRPGQTAVYTFTAKVNSGQPGSRVKGTTRALVNEHEGIAPVHNYLNILGGATQPAQTGAGPALAQTGPMTNAMMLILSAIAYLGYQTMKKRSYAKLKREALEF